MQAINSAGTPEPFAQRIHPALRAWHTSAGDGLLNDLLQARDLHAERPGLSARLITNQVLSRALDDLKQVDEVAANILQWRFPDQLTAQAVGFRLNVSEDIVYQRQRAAITQLAGLLWAREHALRRQQRRRIEARLEPPAYTRLFGVAETLTAIRALLETPSDPWLLAIEGLGGMGKTSLADALARELAEGAYFREIVWVSARRRLFQLSGNIESLEHRPSLTLPELVDRCLDQLGLGGLQHRSDSEKHSGLRDYLASHPCLLVVDNLESAADYADLVTHCWPLVNPGKVLFTTRQSLRDMSGVYVETLGRLSAADASALIRHEAATRGLPELAQASDATLRPIHDVTGGNPLAVKLIIGQIHTLSLDTALAYFAGAKGQPVEALLDYVFEAAWRALDDQSREVLRALLLVADEGGQMDQIRAAVDLDEHLVAECLHRLAALALVNVSGDLRERRYGLHPLTQLFVAKQAMNDNR